MARSIWKLGKFDKGINSHTDPKDIADNEWAELDDVDISKVGVATIVGQPEPDTSVLDTDYASGLFGGKGLYKFNSDNTFLPPLPEGNNHNITLTEEGSDGSAPNAEFTIESLVWLFNGKPSLDGSTTTISFQLKVGGVAIMDPMVVISGDLAMNTGESISTSTNVFATTTWAYEGEGAFGFEDLNAAKYTNIPHQLCRSKDYSDTVSNGIDCASNTGSTNQWAAWNSHTFWEQINANQISESHNLNKSVIPFSATYTEQSDSWGGATGNYPTGALDYNGNYYMLGFYKWDGYNNDVLADGGTVEAGDYHSEGTDFYPDGTSAFCAPLDSEFQESHHNYQKAKLAFIHNVIAAINSYTSGPTNSNYTAHWDSGGEIPDGEADGINLTANSNFAAPNNGEITADITCSASGGATFVTSGVNLLSSSDTFGTGYGYTDGSTWEGVGTLTDYEVNDTDGGSMVIAGDTHTTAGAAINGYYTYRFDLSGNPGSGHKLTIELVGNGSETFEIEANYAHNNDFATAISNTIFNGTPVQGNSSTGTPYYVSNIAPLDSSNTSANDSYSIDITTGIIGDSGYFQINAYWTNQLNDIPLASPNFDDEQICLIKKYPDAIDSYMVSGVEHSLYRAGFTLFSNYMSTWIHSFKNEIDWLWSDSYKPDPIFYDEGNMLRIIDTNFDLKKLPQVTNEAKWLGYKDLTNQFKDEDGNLAYDLPVDTYNSSGFFMGNQKKVWEYTGDADEGLSQTNNALESVYSNANSSGMSIYTYVEPSAGGIDWVGTIKLYAVACYDDGSESLPGHKFTTDLTFGDSEGIENGQSLRIQCRFRPVGANGNRAFSDIRINGIRLYYTHSEENHSTFWNLGKFDFNKGFIKATIVNTVDDTTGNEGINYWTQPGFPPTHMVLNPTYIEYLEMPKTESFEDINGFAVDNNSLFVDYKSICIAGRRTFIGNIRVWNGSFYEYYNDRIVVSPVNSLDTFPYPDNILDFDISDGDKIIALASFGDKVLQFKEKMAYILNISTGIAADFFVEERHKWKGIMNRNHTCTTDEGIFWVNDRGAWIFDGTEVKDLFIMGDDDESQQKIDSNEWAAFISDDTLVGYNAPTREIIILKNHTHASKADADCFIFSLIVNAWTKGKNRFYSASNKSMTNFINTGKNGALSFIREES